MRQYTFTYPDDEGKPTTTLKARPYPRHISLFAGDVLACENIDRQSASRVVNRMVKTFKGLDAWLAESPEFEQWFREYVRRTMEAYAKEGSKG